MTINQLMQRVIDAYPDPDIIATYWSVHNCRPCKGKGGDTLAEFIVLEIYQNFYPEKTDKQKLADARKYIRGAIRDLRETVRGLL